MTSADDDVADDLDAFFDDVEEQVAVVAVQEDEVKVATIHEPDATSTAELLLHSVQNKKIKLNESQTTLPTPSVLLPPPPPPQPRGVVVASSAAATTTTTTTTITQQQPSTASSNTAHHHSLLYTSNTAIQYNVPTIPTSTSNGTIGPIHVPSHHHQQQQQQQHLNSIGSMNPPSSTTTLSHSYSGPILVPQQPMLTLTTDPSDRAASKPDTNNGKKPHIRTVAGKVWVDPSLSDWPDNDYRIFVGNLDPTVTDQQLYQHFASHYSSLNQVRIVRDKKKNDTSLGYGFVSLLDPIECAKAIREQDQSWLGGRPIRIKRSHWKDRELQEKQNKQKQQLHRHTNKRRR